jgi:hypothetical protein
MRTLTQIGLLLVISFASASLTTASPPIQVPKYTGTNTIFDGFYSNDFVQQVDLPVALFQHTNTLFDTEIYESVRKTVKEPAVVSFFLITFIFSSPSTNDPVYSFSEMGNPDELIWSGKVVSRRPGSTNQIPLIRVSTVDRHGKELTADLDLLLGVAPLNNPKDVEYVRRSFHFVYRDGWKGDLVPTRATDKATGVR